jgi:hypothetical protein
MLALNSRLNFTRESPKEAERKISLFHTGSLGWLVAVIEFTVGYPSSSYLLT